MDMIEKKLLEGSGRERIEEAARLEGITFEEAVKRRKGFRYLYWSFKRGSSHVQITSWTPVYVT